MSPALDLWQYVATFFGGASVGLTLALIGGGGSLLAVPLLFYVVGIRSMHAAIGTSAAAVALSAFGALVFQARQGNVHWQVGGLFAGFGVFGALVGARLGQSIDSATLVWAFGLLLVVLGLLMFRSARKTRGSAARSDRGMGPTARSVPAIALNGSAVGLASGFFGIGGGFLAVPGLMHAARLPVRTAIGTSPLCIACFGATTAAAYLWSGLIDGKVLLVFLAGSGLGAGLANFKSKQLPADSKTLTYVLVSLVLIVGIWMLVTPLAATEHR